MKMPTYNQCRTCAAKDGPKAGFYYIDLPNNQKGVVECDCHISYIQQVNLILTAQVSNIWPQALSYDIERDYVGLKSRYNIPRLLKYVNNFKDYSDAMVYIYGPNCTQKTTIGNWIGASLLKQGKKVQYILMHSLISTLADGYESDEKRARITPFRTVDLLIVDESFSRDKVSIAKSGYQIPYFDRFLRERFEFNKKGIVFISNKAPTEICDQGFGVSIQNLVVRNTVPIKTNLLFEDQYFEEKASFDIKGLFDEA
jgi:hypothetical protein